MPLFYYYSCVPQPRYVLVTLPCAVLRGHSTFRHMPLAVRVMCYGGRPLCSAVIPAPLPRHRRDPTMTRYLYRSVVAFVVPPLLQTQLCPSPKHDDPTRLERLLLFYSLDVLCSHGPCTLHTHLCYMALTVGRRLLRPHTPHSCRVLIGWVNMGILPPLWGYWLGCIDYGCLHSSCSMVCSVLLTCYHQTVEMILLPGW